MSAQNAYKHLEARPHKWRKQLYLKERNMTVWHVIAVMRANGYTPERMAKNYGLPVEAIREALDYYEKNKELVQAEVEAEKQWLIAKGHKLERAHASASTSMTAPTMMT